MSYKSPIEIIENMTDKLIQEKEKYILNEIWHIGVNVDKDELIRALQYDRGQYEKGYADGMKDAIPIEWLINYVRREGQNVPLEDALYDWEKENSVNISEGNYDFDEEYEEQMRCLDEN